MRTMIAFTLAAMLSAPAFARPYDEIMAEARDAFGAEDFHKAASLLDEAQTERPYSLYLTRNRILARILTDRMDEAIALAGDAAERGLVLETPPNEAFDRMRAEPAFAPVAAQMSENAKPKGVSHVAMEYEESGLLPEAISKRKGRLLVGGVRTGTVKAAGSALISFGAADGGVFDIEQRKGAVYAAINNQLAFERRNEKPAFAAISVMDPNSGLEKRRVAITASDALVGDIEVDKRGRIYASDSLSPRIFSADKRGVEASIFAADDRWANLQGIALDEKSNRLFAADYLTGLFVVDLTTGKVTAIANPSGAHLGGIDGLYLYEGDLIGIQNGASPQRIVRIDLDKAGTTARALEVVQQALPEWNEPTHGIVDGDEFIYIATSNWPAYDDEGNLREGAKLAPLRIMSVSLKSTEN